METPAPHTETSPAFAKLSPRRKAFVQSFVETGLIYQSYLLAGYKAKNENSGRASASQLFHRPEVQKAIQELQRAAAAQAEVEAGEILARVDRAACLDIRSLFDEWGRPYRLHELPEGVAALLNIEFGNEDGALVVKKVTTPDRLQALTLALRHRGLLDGKKADGADDVEEFAEKLHAALQVLDDPVNGLVLTGSEPPEGLELCGGKWREEFDSATAATCQ